MKPARPEFQEAPFPDTYDGCIAEIRRLRDAQYEANMKWAEARVELHRIKKSRRNQNPRK